MLYNITILHLATESAAWPFACPNILHFLMPLVTESAIILPPSALTFLQIVAVCSLALVCLLAGPSLSTLYSPYIPKCPISGARSLKTKQPAQPPSADTYQVLGAFAKDIRPPVMSALTHLQDIAKQSDTDTTKAAVHSLCEALKILNDTSELAAHRTLSRNTQPTPIDLRRLLLELHKEFAATAKMKNLGFEFFVDDSLPETVELDREKLIRVLGTLLDQAITSTNQGHVHLSLQTIKYAQGVLTLAVSITDTGHGFDSQDQRLLLNPLLQLETSYAHSGNRFGLALCQRLLNHLGSELQLDSRLGKGTTVSFLLHATHQVIQQNDSEYPSLQGLTVLYAEDEPLIRALTMQTLLQQQINVTEVQNGHDLIEQTKHQSPDMVLIDLQMPGMNGVEVIRALKHQKPKISAPIFVLTSHATSRLADDARSAGADQIFTKPLQILPLASAYHTWQLKNRPIAEKNMRTVRSQNALLNLKSFTAIISSTGANFENRYLPEFQTQLTRDLSQLHNQLMANQMETAEKLAHTCIGLCEIMGAEALSKKLRQIETACRAKEAAHIQRLTKELPSLLHDTCEQMKVLLQHMPQSRFESTHSARYSRNQPITDDSKANNKRR